MSTLIREKQDFQREFLDKLVEIGYEEVSQTHYDRLFAIDRTMLFRFLEATQPETMTALRKVYKEKAEDTIVATINAEETKAKGSRLNVLKHGIELANRHLDLMYTKPETNFNPKQGKLYGQNVFSVAEEVCASDKERIDLVLFLNGLAIVAIELKSNLSGQSYQDAIYQYRKDRDPKTRLFRFKAGVLVAFAIDLERVYMTTKLDKEATYFLPFNQGNGEGIYAGAGNPVYEDKYSICYMWEDILQKETLLEIISKFMFIESKEKESEDGKKKIVETVIFPRYHQLDVIRKLVADVRVNHTSQNYLLQHSAGSGKTNEIAWLAHRLASLHDDDNNIIYDNIVICTDRVVVDRQLQDAVTGIEHKAGLIRVMDDKCTSADLASSLKGNTKIVATTIQKFPYILDSVKNLNKKHFAVIIDESHSSTAGKNMAAVTQALGSDDSEIAGIEDTILKQIGGNGKQTNISMFGFTATPKPTTLQLFGRRNDKGQLEAFHIYSMKQAIEEGFILDVLQNYVTYQTYYQLNKSIKDDPTLKTNEAKRQIARFIELHETNIAQRIEVIVEHFRTSVMQELDGKAKAMVVTASRAGAVKYRQAFEDYVNRKGYKDIKALVAFSGKVCIEGEEFTEPGLNGVPEKDLPKTFDKDEYQVLLVADKYQTGFDQKKLCAMYILKKLHGVTTVQTLSRLNRICPPFDKKTFILDFANDYESIEKDFSTYYTTTLLANSVTPQAVYELEAKIDGYYIIDPNDIESFNDILYSGVIDANAKKKLRYYLEKTKKVIEKNYNHDEQLRIAQDVRHFVRFYEFLLQVSCFEDIELHKKYNFLSYLSSFLKTRTAGSGFNLDGKIKATGFVQKKTGTRTQSNIPSDPIVKLPDAERIGRSCTKEEKLSAIIAEINSRTGNNYDTDVAVKALLQIRDLMLKSQKLKVSAKNNNMKDFEFSFFDNIDDALMDGLEQNQDFFTLLLNNDEIKKETLGIFMNEIYTLLKGGDAKEKPVDEIEKLDNSENAEMATSENEDAPKDEANDDKADDEEV